MVDVDHQRPSQDRESVHDNDFQKVAALIHDFLLKLGDGYECAELRDALNLALFQLQRYYRLLQKRLGNVNLMDSVHVYGSTTFSQDPEDKFTWKWIDLERSGISDRLNPDAGKVPELLLAAQSGNNGFVVQVIEDESGPGLGETDSLGRNALMYAVHSSQLDTIELLLNQGIDINHTANDGATALHWACRHGNDEALEIMLQYGADVTLGDAYGRLPIHWAAVNSDIKCLQLLLKHGSNVSAADSDGLTPSMWASHLDCLESLKLLLDWVEVDELERDERGRTWVHWGIRRTGPMSCLTALLNRDLASVEDNDGKTVMHIAAEMGSLPALKIILNISGNSCLERRDHSNRTPLILTTMGGHGESVNFLLAQEANPACVDECGATAWDYARARQLHYCMLIIASYLRQQQKEGKGGLDSLFLESSGDFQHAKPVMNASSANSHSVPHPPFDGNIPPGFSRTPRSSRRAFVTPRASDYGEDGANHVSAFQKVTPGRKMESTKAFNQLSESRVGQQNRDIGKPSDRGSGNVHGDMPAERKVDRSNQGENSSAKVWKQSGRAFEKTGVPNDENESDGNDSSNDGDEDYGGAMTDDSASERQPKIVKKLASVKPSVTKRHPSNKEQNNAQGQSVSVNSGVVRPVNPAANYNGGQRSTAYRPGLQADDTESDENEDQLRHHQRSHNSQKLKSHSKSSVSYDTPQPSETKNTKYSRASASQKQKFWTAQQKVVNNEWSDEVASELDESSDELMTGYRRNGNRHRIQSQNSGKRLNSHESQAFSPERQRSQSASRPNVRGAKSDGASIKFHHQPVKNKDHVTRPEEAYKTDAKKVSNAFDLMPLSPSDEAKGRMGSKDAAPHRDWAARTIVSPRPHENERLASAGAKERKTNDKTTRQNDKPKADLNKRKDLRLDNRLPPHNHINLKRQQPLNIRQEEEDDDDNGMDDDRNSSNEEDYDGDGGYEDHLHTGEKRSFQTRISLPDHSNSSYSQNSKGFSRPLKEPLHNAQLFKDVVSPRSRGAHLSPLIVPQRKQSASRIPPVISTAAAATPPQKASEIRKQPNGQLPSKLR